MWRLLRFVGATAASLALCAGLLPGRCDALGIRSGAGGGRISDLILDEGGGPGRRDLLQDVVTWDDKSLFIRGKRVMIFSGEFHPFRLPVPSLWLDVFQKVKALGLNTVSFSVDWGLLEGKPGEFRTEGVFDLEPFFQAAKDTGVYLIARPGPYISAETSGGGFPGWLQRLPGRLRTNDTDYLAATENYVSNVGRIIAKHQITNGGPVILVQPENEYTEAADREHFPNGYYMQHVIDQYRRAGVVVPMINDDGAQAGHNAPGTGIGAVDIYGHNDYPIGFNCAAPDVWPPNRPNVTGREVHMNISPKTPYSILEFQGGSADGPGGPGYESCAALANHEFERVLYKNSYGAGVSIFNIYMIFGGTNWGNLGHPGGYTSYDYGAAITEDRTVTREKYSELKLQAQFLKVSPGYLTAEGGTNTTNFYNANPSITTTPVLGGGGGGSFFVVRHLQYAQMEPTNYTLNLPTSLDFQVLPKGSLAGSLSLTRRDSKIHVTDYPVGDAATLLYCTAEIFTWLQRGDVAHLVVYTGPGEIGELAVRGFKTGTLLEGSGVSVEDFGDFVVAQWAASTERRVLQIGRLLIYIVDRNSAYNYWVPELGNSTIIINGGYLIRSAALLPNVDTTATTLSIKADLNATTALEIIGVPPGVSKLLINSEERSYTPSPTLANTWLVDVPVPQFRLAVPDLSKLDWHYVDALPELAASYDDSGDPGWWLAADHRDSNNTSQGYLLTPTSLLASDYGFHSGAVLYRGRFVASGRETHLRIRTQGGLAFASSVWLNGTLLGSWSGDAREGYHAANYTIPLLLKARLRLTRGAVGVLTVLVDTMGHDQNPVVGLDEMKNARGILSYGLISGDGLGAGDVTNVTWRIAGNAGGEDYVDKARGPRNEGGFFAERMGFHLPFPPVSSSPLFHAGSPFGGRANSSSPNTNATATALAVPSSGARLFVASMALSLPSPRYDIPVAFSFVNESSAAFADFPRGGGAFRALLFVNGWLFGRYASNIGPQQRFPVPEGILNYRGDNWVGVLLWSLEDKGAVLPGFYLDVRSPVWTGREEVKMVESPRWVERRGAS